MPKNIDKQFSVIKRLAINNCSNIEIVDEISKNQQYKKAFILIEKVIKTNNDSSKRSVCIANKD